MHSAQKQEMPRESAPSSSAGASTSGFGKVLTSIQGLQQRLDDFSVEDVSRAGEKARNIIDELDRLRAQLGAISSLKGTLAAAKKTLAELPKDDFEPGDLDGLEKHPKLRAIIQAGKLIRMHRLLRIAQASAESVSLDLAVGKTNKPPSTSETGNEKFEAIPESPVFADVSASPEKSPDASVESAFSDTGHTAALQAQPAIEAKATAPAYEFADLKLESASEPAQTAPKRERAARKSEKHAPFDQRLLDDVIETYGEFATLSQADASPSPGDIRAQAADDPTVRATPSASTDLVAAQPASAQSGAGALITLPAPELLSAQARAEAEIVAGKSQEEIDRQLKNIIKDYGEYDLYSHRKSTLDFKTAAIVAVAVLGLLLGGFYIFKAPSGSAPVAMEAIESNQTGTVRPENPTQHKN